MPARATRGRGDAPPPVPRRLRDRARRRAQLDALDRRRSQARRARRASTPRPTSLDPMQARDRRPLVRGRARARCLHPARARYPGAPDAAAARRGARARSSRWFADPAQAQGRPERQVRPARARATTASRCAASRTTRCSSPTCSKRTEPPRHGLARQAPSRRQDASRYEDVAGKGAKQIRFDQVALDDATRYAAEDADITLRLHRVLYPKLAADADARARLRDDRDAAGAGARARWSATAC